MDNFYAAETPIIERLKDVLELRDVISQADTSTLPVANAPDESIAVIYNDFRVNESDDEDYSIILQQRWFVVPMVRNVADMRSGKAALDRAGELHLRVIQILNGWRPTPEHGPLHLSAPGARRFYDNKSGMAYAPALFETLITIASDN